MSIEEDGVSMLRKFKDRPKKEPWFRFLSIHQMSKLPNWFSLRIERLLFREREKEEDLRRESTPDKKLLTDKYLLSI